MQKPSIRGEKVAYFQELPIRQTGSLRWPPRRSPRCDVELSTWSAALRALVTVKPVLHVPANLLARHCLHLGGFVKRALLQEAEPHCILSDWKQKLGAKWLAEETGFVGAAPKPHRAMLLVKRGGRMSESVRPQSAELGLQIDSKHISISYVGTSVDRLPTLHRLFETFWCAPNDGARNVRACAYVSSLCSFFCLAFCFKCQIFFSVQSSLQLSRLALFLLRPDPFFRVQKKKAKIGFYSYFALRFNSEILIPMNSRSLSSC